MKKLFALGLLFATASAAFAAPNVTNATQKGSLLVWPLVVTADNTNTLIRIQNDGSLDVDVICYWMDADKNRVDFIIPVTRNQAVWFDARTGNGTFQVNTFPQGPANGLPGGNPFINQGEGFGLLACWAVDGGAQNQVKWNHLSGTATIYNSNGAVEYNAYAFFVPTGLDQEPVGVAGALNLNGVEYDSCPLYQIGQFSPVRGPSTLPGQVHPRLNVLAVAGCTLELQQDYTPIWTKLQFDVWNEEEVKFTGAYECADSWHLTQFIEDVDAAAQNFQSDTLGTYAARYRVQGVKSTQCEQSGRVTQAVGIIGVQVSVAYGSEHLFGTTLAAAGKFTGKITWDPEGAVPEGGIR